MRTLFPQSKTRKHQLHEHKRTTFLLPGTSLTLRCTQAHDKKKAEQRPIKLVNVNIPSETLRASYKEACVCFAFAGVRVHVLMPQAWKMWLISPWYTFTRTSREFLLVLFCVESVLILLLCLTLATLIAHNFIAPKGRNPATLIEFSVFYICNFDLCLSAWWHIACLHQSIMIYHHAQMVDVRALRILYAALYTCISPSKMTLSSCNLRNLLWSAKKQSMPHRYATTNQTEIGK